MCSAVFITGLDPDFAAENVGYFTAPYAIRSRLGKPVIDRESKAVHVSLPNGVRRTAKHVGNQGCVTLPVGQHSPAFTPVVVKIQLRFLAETGSVLGSYSATGTNQVLPRKRP